MIKIYGIKNCDTVKMALKWLVEQGVAHQFHDLRKDGLAREQLESWVRELGVETILNKRGTTWRKLPEDQKSDLDAAKVIELLLAHPAMIKRPVFDLGDRRRVGFSKQDQIELTRHLFP